MYRVADLKAILPCSFAMSTKKWDEFGRSDRNRGLRPELPVEQSVTKTAIVDERQSPD
jgi:hypothetical protein